MTIADYHAHSVWRATANHDAGFSVLNGDCQTDVLIIGGGFTGLSAAYALNEQGIETVVVESRDIGSGASGRTGGLAVPQYKKNFASLAETWGDATTVALFNQVKSAIDQIEDNVRTFSIDCDFHRPGHMTPAHSKRAMDGLEKSVDWLSAKAGDDTARILDREEAARALGTNRYYGAYFDPRGASIQPYAYVRGFAAGLKERGVPIFVQSGVEKLDRQQDYWYAKTRHGGIRARRVILATNGYTEPLLPGDKLHRCVVPVASSVVATRPLTDAELTQVLPAQIPVTDTQRLVNYYRILPNHQLVFGGRGDITGRRNDPEVFRTLENQLARIFPQIAGIELHQRWSGMVAVTANSFPQIGAINERVFFALGYAGRGVALSHLLGRRLAALATGEKVPSDPMMSSKLQPFPFHRWRRTGMRVVAKYYRLLDLIER